MCSPSVLTSRVACRLQSQSGKLAWSAAGRCSAVSRRALSSLPPLSPAAVDKAGGAGFRVTLLLRRPDRGGYRSLGACCRQAQMHQARTKLKVRSVCTATLHRRSSSPLRTLSSRKSCAAGSTRRGAGVAHHTCQLTLHHRAISQHPQHHR